MKTDKTITIEELKRLCFCNSDRLQNMLVRTVDGNLNEWVGIGWVTVKSNPDNKEIYTIEV